jgi:hypothetical protein
MNIHKMHEPQGLKSCNPIRMPNGKDSRNHGNTIGQSFQLTKEYKSSSVMNSHRMQIGQQSCNPIRMSKAKGSGSRGSNRCQFFQLMKEYKLRSVTNSHKMHIGPQLKSCPASCQHIRMSKVKDIRSHGNNVGQSFQLMKECKLSSAMNSHEMQMGPETKSCNPIRR